MESFSLGEETDQSGLPTRGNASRVAFEPEETDREFMECVSTRGKKDRGDGTQMQILCDCLILSHTAISFSVTSSLHFGWISFVFLLYW
jgi:hypothetical protein